jgi:hypothetical protein
MRRWLGLLLAVLLAGDALAQSPGTVLLQGPSTNPAAPLLSAQAVSDAINQALTAKMDYTPWGAIPPLGGTTPNTGAFTSLQVGLPGGFAFSNNRLQVTDNVNGFAQLGIQNLSAGTTASSDLIASTDTATDSTGYVDTGINGSGNTDSLFTIAGALDGYSYVNGGNYAIGTATAGKTLKFFTAGTLAANLRVTISDTGLQGAIGATTPSTGAFTTLSATGQITSTLANGTAPFVVSSATLVANLNASYIGGQSWSAPGTIGSATPNTGAFTTLNATGLITPSSTVGVKGTATNDAAQAGSVGEFLSATVLGNAVSLTTVTPANLVTLALTAGDWDCHGSANFIPAGTTTVSLIQEGLNTTSATFPATNSLGQVALTNATLTTGTVQVMGNVAMRVLLSGPSNVYLVGQMSFAVSTATGGGYIGCRRAR